MVHQVVSWSEVSKKIKRIVYSVAGRLGVGIDKIVLFGSRARGDFREDSDWDILVVTREKLSKDMRRKLQITVYRELCDAGIYADVLVIDRDTLERLKDDVGYVYYYALREGIVL